MDDIDSYLISAIQHAERKVSIAENNLSNYIMQNIKECHREPLRNLWLKYEMVFTEYYGEIKEKAYQNGFTDCAEAVKTIFK